MINGLKDKIPEVRGFPIDPLLFPNCRWICRLRSVSYVRHRSRKNFLPLLLSRPAGITLRVLTEHFRFTCDITHCEWKSDCVAPGGWGPPLCCSVPRTGTLRSLLSNEEVWTLAHEVYHVGTLVCECIIKILWMWCEKSTVWLHIRTSTSNPKLSSKTKTRVTVYWPAVSKFLSSLFQYWMRPLEPMTFTINEIQRNKYQPADTWAFMEMRQFSGLHKNNNWESGCPRGNDRCWYLRVTSIATAAMETWLGVGYTDTVQGRLTGGGEGTAVNIPIMSHDLGWGFTSRQLVGHWYTYTIHFDRLWTLFIYLQ